MKYVLKTADGSREVRESKRSIIGIIMCIFYICAFVYIYSTALKNIERAPAHVIVNGQSVKNPYKRTLYTLSDAISRSDRFGSTVFLMTFIGLMIDKNMFNVERFNETSSVIVANFVIVAGILLLYVWPTDHDYTTMSKGDFAHFFIAFLIIATVVYNCFMLSRIFKQIFEPNRTLVALEVFGYLTIIAAISAASVMAYDFVMKTNNYKLKVAIGVAELVVIFSYLVSLSIITSVPVLSKFDQLCVEVEV